MSTDISRDIAALLYQHDSVIIPELGGIIANYQPASVDHVQGQILPPSKQLSFNENLLINDGVLIDYLQKEKNISQKESSNLINAFVTEIKSKLDNKEIVVFSEIGRLYKDYEGALKFLQDTTNFNTSMFGLPVLMFYPILRTKVPVPEPEYKNTVSKTRVDDKFNPLVFSKVVKVAVPALFIVLLAFTIFSIYDLQKSDSTNVEISALKLPIENRINQKPSVSNLSIIDNGDVNESPREIIEEEVGQDLSASSPAEIHRSSGKTKRMYHHNWCF